MAGEEVCRWERCYLLSRHRLQIHHQSHRPAQESNDQADPKTCFISRGTIVYRTKETDAEKPTTRTPSSPVRIP